MFVTINRKWARPPVWLFWLRSRHKSSPWGMANEGTNLNPGTRWYIRLLANILVISYQVFYRSVFAAINRKWAPPPVWPFWLRSRNKSNLWGIAKGGTNLNPGTSWYLLVLANILAIPYQVSYRSVYAKINRKWAPPPVWPFWRSCRHKSSPWGIANGSTRMLCLLQ